MVHPLSIQYHTSFIFILVNKSYINTITYQKGQRKTTIKRETETVTVAGGSEEV